MRAWPGSGWRPPPSTASSWPAAKRFRHTASSTASRTTSTSSPSRPTPVPSTPPSPTCGPRCAAGPNASSAPPLQRTTAKEPQGRAGLCTTSRGASVTGLGSRQERTSGRVRGRDPVTVLRKSVKISRNASATSAPRTPLRSDIAGQGIRGRQLRVRRVVRPLLPQAPQASPAGPGGEGTAGGRWRSSRARPGRRGAS